jgi:hypothetical protein
MVGIAGCGDDGNDIKKPDAPGPPIDAMSPMFKGYLADEGGEVRVEFTRFGVGAGAARVGAFFYDNPGSTRFWPFVSLNGCTDTTTDKNWPTAASPMTERTYLDPGKVIIAGGPQVLSVPRLPLMAPDAVGRIHPAGNFFLHFNGPTGVDAPTYMPEKTKLDVILTGSNNMPGQVFRDVLYMPADFALTSPGPANLEIPAATPQTFTWTTPANNEPQGYEVGSVVAFTTQADGPAVICAEKNDGSITVPANMIDVVRAKFPNGGFLSRQTLTHVVRELVDNNGPTGKRIDFIASFCYLTTFSVPQ